MRLRARPGCVFLSGAAESFDTMYVGARRLWEEYSGVAKVLALVGVPFVVLFIYLHLSIQVSLLNRQIAIATQRKEELVRKNDALKSALHELARSRGHADMMPADFSSLLENNRIVRVRLPAVREIR